MRCTARKGFTLIELLIAIAVVAIILTIGLPSFKTLFDNNKLKGGSDALYFMLNLTRTESIKRNKDVYLKVITGDNWCVGVNENDASCDCNVTPSTCDIASMNAVGYEGLTLSSTYVTPRFDRVRGAFNESDKLFTLQSDSNSAVQVRINLLGSVRMCGVNGALDLYDC